MLLADLAKIEIHLMTDAASERLDVGCERIWENGFKAGHDLFELWQRRESLSPKEAAVLQSIMGELENSPWGSGGFDESQENYERYGDDVYEHESDEILAIDAHREYLERKTSEIKKMATTLEPQIATLEPVQTYRQLLSLDKELLSALVGFEELCVELLEATNEAIDFQSSGHHRDTLEIYQFALEGEESPDDCFIYMDDDGKLLFSPYEDVKRRLK